MLQIFRVQRERFVYGLSHWCVLQRVSIAFQARKSLVATLQSVVDERRALKARNLSPAKKDMMDNLIDVEDENGRRLNDEEIIDILIMYLNAGHESSGHITMWATVFLQENPDIFEKTKVAYQSYKSLFYPIS